MEKFKDVCSWDVNGWLNHLCHFIYTKLSPIAMLGGPPELKDVDWLSSDSLDWSLTLKIHDKHLLGSIEHFDYQRVDSKDAKEQEYQYYFPFVLTMRLIVTPFKSIFLTRNYNLSHFTIIEVNRVF